MGYLLAQCVLETPVSLLTFLPGPCFSKYVENLLPRASYNAIVYVRSETVTGL